MPDSFVVNVTCDRLINVGWPRLSSLHCNCSSLTQNLRFRGGGGGGRRNTRNKNVGNKKNSHSLLVFIQAECKGFEY